MKTRYSFIVSHTRSLAWTAMVLLYTAQILSAADFNVTTPGGAFAFTINGQNPNPTLTLMRGKTYTFAVTTSSIHPFNILTTGVTNNSISSGIITWKVPLADTNYAYECAVHHFTGTIITVPPPPIQIVDFFAGSNLVLRSTGTNFLTLLPEFRTNLNSTNWFALTVQTNRFLTGTNETICGRPPDNTVFIRIRAQ
ncbi:MAG: hypothetical protein ACR2H1_10160 [Limisphaerales bacterium]